MIRFLAKLGIYQQKVFISQYIKCKGKEGEGWLYYQFHIAGYLFWWQYVALCNRSIKKMRKNGLL
ncbi:hypothetical protein CVD19_00150 [Bacillus sp. T33-2]|nr:hypothetical protein CVD19_00150 [Bacillus sp. T33-2]